MCRRCPIPGCLVLMVGTDPFCSRHWAKVPERVRSAMETATARQARAMTINSWQDAGIEYQVAHDMAVSFATGQRHPITTTNTAAAAAPPAPIAG